MYLAAPGVMGAITGKPWKKQTKNYIGPTIQKCLEDNMFHHATHPVLNVKTMVLSLPQVVHLLDHCIYKDQVKERDSIVDQCFFCSPHIVWATEEILISNRIYRQ
jgi:hypothetical protein